MGLEIFVDGGSRGNPGPGGAGVYILDRDDNLTVSLHEGGYYFGNLTNNAAEYRGLIRALELAVEMGYQNPVIHSDSQLMVRQVNGEYKVKSNALRPFHSRVLSLLSHLGHWRLVHVYREKNVRADELANLAMDAKRDVIVNSAIPMDPSPASADSVNTSKLNPEDGKNKRPLTADPLTDCWSTSLLVGPGSACPAPFPAGKVIRFGPQPPVGLCVYATWSVLNEVLDRGQYPSNGDNVRTNCARCGVTIQITKVTA